MSIVSNNIKYLRRLNGLTQEQFARKIGIKRSLLGAYEESRANPNLVNLKNMASAFGVSVDNMLKNDLRRIKETPNLGSFQSNPARPAPSSPLMSDPATPVQSPKPIAEILDNYQTPPPAPLRMVARPVALKNVYNNPLAPPIKEPVYQASSTQQSNSYVQEKEEVVQQEANFVSPTTPVEQPVQNAQNDIPLVTRVSVNEYLRAGKTTGFLTTLATIRIPNLPQGNYRAFEATDDFPFPGSVVVGSFVGNSGELVDGSHYLLVIPHEGVVYRRVYNQIKIKGLLVLTSDQSGIATTEVAIRDVAEIWAIKAFIGYEVPTFPQASERLKRLVNELQQELEGNRSF